MKSPGRVFDSRQHFYVPDWLLAHLQGNHKGRPRPLCKLCPGRPVQDVRLST